MRPFPFALVVGVVDCAFPDEGSVGDCKALMINEIQGMSGGIPRRMQGKRRELYQRFLRNNGVIDLCNLCFVFALPLLFIHEIVYLLQLLESFGEVIVVGVRVGGIFQHSL